MKYEIITLDSEKNTRIVWATFVFTTDRKAKDKLISMFEYLKNSSAHFEVFLLYEVDTDRAIPLADNYEKLIKVLSK